ncbi:MAG: FHA domain-containing protein [Acidimicrobiales bacterium]
MASVSCPRCGHDNPLGANFCSSCGFALDVQSDDTTAMVVPAGATAASRELGGPGDVELVAVPSPPAVLIVKRGAKAGSRIELSEPRITCGRHPDSDIFLDDITVSRRHADIVHTAAGYEVIDVGSLNGTYVNRQRVDRMRLGEGDELQIGKFKLVFMAAEPARAAR